MESNSVSGTATFVAVNLDPRKLPSKVLRRLRYGNILYVIGPNDDEDSGYSQLIWSPDRDAEQLSDDDSDTNSLTGDEINGEDGEQTKTNKKTLRMICSNE